MFSAQTYHLAIGLMGILCLGLAWLWISAEIEINKHIMVFYNQPRARRRPEHRGIIRRIVRRLVADEEESITKAKQLN